ncbi:MAG: hypothetical protein O2790_03515 [Bacteroidetes bacterium]|nr:hypothetical protein [Bacteroidota bacterium]
MTEKIKTALVEWAELVIKDQALWENDEVHLAIQKLYEISVCQKFLNQGSSSSERLKRQQEELSSILNSMTSPVPEILEKKEDLEVPPMMETIKNMVTEMPEPESYERLFETVEESPVFIPKPSNESVKEGSKHQPTGETEERKNLNDHFAKSLTIDLNDRLSFIKHLFEENTSAYESVISQVITFSQWKEVEVFIESKVKIEYPHWENKKLIEERFLGILKKNFKG